METRRKAPTAASQTDLFPAAPAGAKPRVSPSPVPASSPKFPANFQGRLEAIRVLLDLCAPVRAGSRSAAWLKEHRIFKKTWDAQGLRHVDNYPRATEELQARFSTAQLAAWGLFNKEGHLRFYRHTLLIPWFDDGNPVHLEAHAPDPATVPPALSLSGAVPCPYNARLLDGAPGRLYLCAGAVDTLEVLEAGFPAVGIPEFDAEQSGLKPAWTPRFQHKSVYIAYDGDAGGEAAAAKALALLAAAGVEAHRLPVPVGKRVGDWLAGK